MTAALIYTRVSSDPKGRGRSVAEQEAECRDVVAREGWDLIGVESDNDRSASRYAKAGRPAWERTKAAIAAGEVDVLVTWEASRAGRDLGAYAELRDLCAANGVRWCYRGKVHDLDTVDGRYDTGKDALDAEREAGATSERVCRAIAANAVAGRPHGKRLYGYQRIYDPATGELVGQEPHPDEAPVIAEAARRFLAGESARGIANDLNTRGIPTPAKGGWDLTRVRRLLTNPAYNGKRVHRGEVIGDAAWEPILDDDTYAALAARFADPSRRTNRAAPTVRLLSGVARCGVCGAAMRYARQGGFVDKRTGHMRTPRLTYTCSGQHCVARDLVALEAFVVAVVLERLMRPDAVEALEGRDDVALDLVAEARDVVADLRNRLQDAVDQFTAGNITGTTLANIEKSLLPKIADAERNVKVSTLPTAAHNVATAEDVAAEWDALAPEQRRAIIKALVEVIVDPVRVRGRKAFDAGSIRIEWRR